MSRGFDSRSGRYQEVTTWMGDCLRTCKPSRYINIAKINSVFHHSGVDKENIGLPCWAHSPGVEWQITPYDPIWQVTLRSFEIGLL